MEFTGCSRCKCGFQMVRDIVVGGCRGDLNGSPDNIRKHDMSRCLDRVSECFLSLYFLLFTLFLSNNHAMVASWR